MEILRSAAVYVQNIYAGRIDETDEGYRFAYDTAYLLGENALPVSLTMPLREDAFLSKTMFPFFDGLIPEGWLLEVVCRNWKISPRDRFGLLLAACRDPIGDVSVVPDISGTRKAGEE